MNSHSTNTNFNPVSIFNNDNGISNNTNDAIMKFSEKIEEENKHLGLSLIMYTDPHMKFVSSLLNMLKTKHLLSKFLLDFYLIFITTVNI